MQPRLGDALEEPGAKVHDLERLPVEPRAGILRPVAHDATFRVDLQMFESDCFRSRYLASRLIPPVSPSATVTALWSEYPLWRHNSIGQVRSEGGKMRSALRDECAVPWRHPLDRQPRRLPQRSLDVLPDHRLPPLRLEVGVVHRRGGSLR